VAYFSGPSAIQELTSNETLSQITTTTTTTTTTTIATLSTIKFIYHQKVLILDMY